MGLEPWRPHDYESDVQPTAPHRSNIKCTLNRVTKPFQIAVLNNYKTLLDDNLLSVLMFWL